MAGDRDREYRRDNPHGDRDRARERQRHSRDDQDYSSRRRSRSRDRYPSPHSRVKREDEDSPPHRRDYSPRDRPRPRQRSLSPYSKRAQRSGRSRGTSPGRQSSMKRSQSPEAWGSHQHDVAHDHSNPRSKSPAKPKEKPNYGLSGLLAAATNMKNGTVLKYQEPPEAKKTKGWITYIYKDEKQIDILRLDSQSSFLVGRDELVHPCNLNLTRGCGYSCHAYFMFKATCGNTIPPGSIKE
jgi:smad nuclear-interacting protein 1